MRIGEISPAGLRMCFRDHFLASDIRKVEQRFRLGHIRNLSDSLIKLIQERYEVSPDGLLSPSNPQDYRIGPLLKERLSPADK